MREIVGVYAHPRGRHIDAMSRIGCRIGNTAAEPRTWLDDQDPRRAYFNQTREVISDRSPAEAAADNDDGRQIGMIVHLSGPLPGSAPGMERRIDPVQEIVAEDRIFPPHRIMQSVGAGVPPMAVEIMLGKCRTGAGELEELVGRRY